MNRILVGWIGLLLIVPMWSIGQSVRAYVPQKVLTTDDVLPLYIEVSGPPLPQSPSFPSLWGMKKLGLNREQANGKTRYIQTYQPTRAGLFEIPAIEVKTGKQTLYTRGITVRVDRGKLPLLDELTARSQGSREVDAFLTYSLSKEQCLVGEQVLAEVKLWIPREKRSRYQWDQRELNALAGQLLLEDCWVESQSPLPDEPEETTHNGRGYLTFLLNKAFLFPLKAKEFELGGGEVFVERLLRNRQGNRPASVEQIRLSLPSTRLSVSPLPETSIPKSESVGTFSLEYSLPKSSFLTGETIPLSVSVSGKGNIAMIPQPNFREPASFLLYDPISSYEVDPAGEQLVGTKEFVYNLVAAFQGNYTLGPIVLHYFELEKGRYDSLEIAQVPIRVQGEDIPQLLEVDALDNFYRDAFERTNTQKPFRFPNQTLIVMLCMGIAIVLIGLNVFRLFR